MTFLDHLARLIGLQRQPVLPPFVNAFDAGPKPDMEGPALPFVRSQYARGLFSEAQRAAVWAKAQPIVGWDPNDWRVDHHGDPLFRGHYGDSSSSFGWEIGHIVPREDGGSDEIANLRPQRCRADRPGFRFAELLEPGFQGR